MKIIITVYIWLIDTLILYGEIFYLGSLIAQHNPIVESLGGPVHIKCLRSLHDSVLVLKYPNFLYSKTNEKVLMDIQGLTICLIICLCYI